MRAAFGQKSVLALQVNKSGTKAGWYNQLESYQAAANMIFRLTDRSFLHVKGKLGCYLMMNERTKHAGEIILKQPVHVRYEQLKKNASFQC